jgi:hypothetical protein
MGIPSHPSSFGGHARAGNCETVQVQEQPANPSSRRKRSRPGRVSCFRSLQGIVGNKRKRHDPTIFSGQVSPVTLHPLERNSSWCLWVLLEPAARDGDASSIHLSRALGVDALGMINFSLSAPFFQVLYFLHLLTHANPQSYRPLYLRLNVRRTNPLNPQTI